jgi:hypothetical protein
MREGRKREGVYGAKWRHSINLADQQAGRQNSVIYNKIAFRSYECGIRESGASRGLKVQLVRDILQISRTRTLQLQLAIYCLSEHDLACILAFFHDQHVSSSRVNHAEIHSRHNHVG